MAENDVAIEIILRLKDELSVVLQKATAEINKFAKSTQDAGGTIPKAFGGNQTAAAVQSIGTAFTGILQRIGVTETAAGGLATTLSEDVAGAAAGAGSSLIGLTSVLGAVGVGLASVIKQGLDFEKELEGIVLELDPVKHSLADLQATVGGLAISLNEDTAGVAAGLARALQVVPGSERDVLKFFIDVAQAARATGSSLVQTVDQVALITNAFGLSINDTSKTIEKLLSASQQARLSFSEVGQGIEQLAPTAAQLGVSFDEVLAAFATIRASGQSSQQAFQALRITLQLLAEDTSPLNQVLGLAGKSFGEDETRSRGLAGTIQDLSAALKESGKSIQDLIPGGRSLAAVFALTANDGRDFESTLGKIQNASGGVQEKLERLSKQGGFVFGQFLETLGVGAKTLGLDIAQAFAGGAEGIEKFQQNSGESLGKFEAALERVRLDYKKTQDALALQTRVTQLGSISEAAKAAEDLRLSTTKLTPALAENSGQLLQLAKSGDLAAQLYAQLADNVQLAGTKFEHEKALYVALANVIQVFGGSVDKVKAAYSDWLRVQSTALLVQQRAKADVDEFRAVFETFAERMGLTGDQVTLFGERVLGLRSDFIELVDPLAKTEGKVRGFLEAIGQLKNIKLEGFQGSSDDFTKFVDALGKLSGKGIRLEEFKGSVDDLEAFLTTLGSVNDELAKSGAFRREMQETGVDADKFADRVKDAIQKVREEVLKPLKLGFAGGFRQEMSELIAAANNAFKQGRAAADGLFSSFQDGIQALILSLGTGKNAFKSFATVFLQEIQRMIAQLISLRIASAFLSFLGLGGGSPGTVDLGNGGGVGAGLPPRAEGGAIEGDRPYIVGEKGKELFVSKKDGWILSNAQTKKLFGGVIPDQLVKPEKAFHVEQFANAKGQRRDGQGDLAASAAQAVQDRPGSSPIARMVSRLQALPARSDGLGGLASVTRFSAVSDRSSGRSQGFASNRGVPVSSRREGPSTIKAEFHLIVQSLDPRTAADTVLAQMPAIQRALTGVLHNHADRRLISAIRGVTP